MKNKSAGFTIVELLLAMAFFSFILLFVTTGFIIVNRAYTKGITVKLIQDEGRKVTEDLSRKLRVASPEGISVDPSGECVEISGTSFYWSVPIDGGDPTSPRHLYEENGSTCSGVNPANTGAVSILDDRVGVQYIEIAGVSGSNSIYSIKIILSTSETDLITGDLSESASCTAGSGNQYCDVVTFSTVVSTR